ncbi:MAG TPA: DoxX family protein [Flavisolibacter sp.]|jgi:putative oxidoreductase|nr:DoxX family protein [Flavisolibacter sp.]
MPNPFYSAEPYLQHAGLALVRMITGVLMIYHGMELFDAEKIRGYGQWLSDLTFPAPVLMAYLGKGAELAGGILLVLGLFTRPAALLIAVTMLTVCFLMGSGKIFTDDQHPFLFVLLAVLFIFTGPGQWSLDHIFFTRKKQ